MRQMVQLIGQTSPPKRLQSPTMADNALVVQCQQKPAKPCIVGGGGARGLSLGAPPPPLCPTNAVSNERFRSDRFFFEDIINYVLNYVPGFRIEVSG